MMQQLRALTERVKRSTARVADAASARFGFTTTNTTAVWNVMPSMPIAICIHGKGYEWRLQEMLT